MIDYAHAGRLANILKTVKDFARTDGGVQLQRDGTDKAPEWANRSFIRGCRGRYVGQPRTDKNAIIDDIIPESCG